MQMLVSMATLATHMIYFSTEGLLQDHPSLPSRWIRPSYELPYLSPRSRGNRRMLCCINSDSPASGLHGFEGLILALLFTDIPSNQPRHPSSSSSLKEMKIRPPPCFVICYRRHPFCGDLADSSELPFHDGGNLDT